uniref:Gamma-glutamyl-gamma-aminobutyrate hydrolase family protein n=1 Tax=Ammonifex degensii TaxID=42838 RepID=A0A7C2E939_9THEO
MRPVIGVTAAFHEEEERAFLSRHYSDGIYRAGGLPVILPPLSPEAAATVISPIDGLLLSDGGDIDPFYFGEEPLPQTETVSPHRDAFELALSQEALARLVPVLGICRGMQVLNVAAGGTIYQDLAAGARNSLKHRQEAPRWHGTHYIDILAGSHLAAIFRTTRLSVNSFHHQAIRKVTPGFKATAWAPDGITEGIEATAHPFAIGVQFHPEGMWKKNPLFLALFETLVTACRAQRK